MTREESNEGPFEDHVRRKYQYHSEEDDHSTQPHPFSHHTVSGFGTFLKTQVVPKQTLDLQLPPVVIQDQDTNHVAQDDQETDTSSASPPSRKHVKSMTLVYSQKRTNPSLGSYLHPNISSPELSETLPSLDVRTRFSDDISVIDGVRNGDVFQLTTGESTDPMTSSHRQANMGLSRSKSKRISPFSLNQSPLRVSTTPAYSTPGKGAFPFHKTDLPSDFLRVFQNDVPSTEKLLYVIRCAYLKQILMDGKLWITENFACYKANMFKTRVILRLEDVISIQRAKFVLIPNGIQFSTRTDSFFFGSVFPPVQPKYEMIKSIWEYQTTLSRSSSVPTDSVRSDYASAASSESLQQISNSKNPFLNNNLPTPPQKPENENLIRKDSKVDEITSGILSANSTLEDLGGGGMTMSPEEHDEQIDVAKPEEALEPVSCSCDVSAFTVVVDQVLDLAFDELLRIWYYIGPDSPFYAFLIGRSFRETHVSQWVNKGISVEKTIPAAFARREQGYCVDSTLLQKGSHCRVTYISPVPTNPFGIRETRVINDVLVVDIESGNYVCLETKAQNLDVPIPAFNLGRTCFHRISENQTRVRVAFRVEFTKASFFKAVVEPKAISEIKSFYQGAASHIASWISKWSETKDDAMFVFISPPPPSAKPRPAKKKTRRHQRGQSRSSFKLPDERPTSRVFLSTTDVSSPNKQGSLLQHSSGILVLTLVVALVAIMIVNSLTLVSMMHFLEATQSQLSQIEARLLQAESRALTNSLSHL